MTEAKSLTESIGEMALDTDEIDFLTNPYRANFMTEFLIGSNKLQFYGYPLIMAKHSELIKTSLTKLVESKPPHSLLEFGVVLERPMTSIWLVINGYETAIRRASLKLDEWFQTYRLTGYFGVDDVHSIVVSLIYAFLKEHDVEKLKESLKNEINRDTLIRAINTFLLSDVRMWYITNPAGEMVHIDNALFWLLTEDLPDIAKEINFIPIWIEDVYITYADRKIVDNPDLFLKYNGISWKQEGKNFTHAGIGKFTPTVWGPDEIRFIRETVSSSDLGWFKQLEGTITPIRVGYNTGTY